MNVSAHVKLCLFKQFDDKVTFYEGVFNKESIKTFIRIYGTKIGEHFDDDTREIVFGIKKPTVFLYTNKEEE